jgi:hypothetical protein
MFSFKSTDNGSYIATVVNGKKALATYTITGDSVECKLHKSHGLTPERIEEMDAAFQAHLEIPQATESPEEQEPPTSPPVTSDQLYPPALPALPAPAPDPVSGTTSIPYMLHIAQHGTDEKFTELYAERLKNKPSFLPWVQRTEELRPFLTRAQKLKLA